MPETIPAVGRLLKEWRSRRRLSQLDLAYDADISPRHLSFLETGRSEPSRDMVLRLAAQLEVPLRERNELLTAAGFAPEFPVRELDDPSLAPARRAIELLLRNQEPFPALAMDRHWNVVFANRSAEGLFAGVDPTLLAPPMNVLRLALHPRGISSQILNLSEVKAHTLSRLRHQASVSRDPVLIALLEELSGFPPEVSEAMEVVSRDEIFVPLQIQTPAGALSFFSTTTVFGSPFDVTLAEITIENFFPADDETARALGTPRQSS